MAPATTVPATKPILIADDDPFALRMLQQTLTLAGHSVVAVADGAAALDHLLAPGGPSLAIIDWMMPGLDGPAVCRQVRQTPVGAAAYLILLTGRASTADLVAGLEAGADDYVTKPFDPGELQARLNVGLRVRHLQQALAERVRELEAALANVRQLTGLLPICAWCKKVRDDGNYWRQVEEYIAARSSATFTHGICPDCTLQMTRTAAGGR